ncbi:MAG: hypothetical protein ABIO64_03090 [Burkholderiaceae bacterium]
MPQLSCLDLLKTAESIILGWHLSSHIDGNRYFFAEQIFWRLQLSMSTNRAVIYTYIISAAHELNIEALVKL